MKYYSYFKPWSNFMPLFAIALAFMILLPTTVPAAHGDKGGGGPETPGVPYGDIYGDLWLVIRNVTQGNDGVPILTSWIWPEEAYIGEVLDIEPGDIPIGYTLAEGNCIQPFSMTPITMPETDDPQFTYTEYVDEYGVSKTVYLIPLDDECKIPEDYSSTWGAEVMEVELGRLNLSRSSQEVIDSSYEEALNTINQAQSIALDPAGRLTITIPSGEDDPVVQLKTIDSPLENLALYQRIMQDGCLSHTTNLTLSANAIEALESVGLSHLICENVTTVDDFDLKSAASFLAGSGDKTSRYNIDTIIYLNNSLGLNTLTSTTKKNGEITIVDYYDFGALSYDRTLVDGPQAELLQPRVLSDVFSVETVNVFEKVFIDDWQSTNYPIVNFTRAADDALGVIFYIHNFTPPEEVNLLP